MAENETNTVTTEIPDPIYLDATAKENGKKLDTIAVLLSSIAESQRTLANSKPDVSLDIDLNIVRKIVAAGMAPKLYPTGTQLVNTYTDKDGNTYSCPWDVVQPDDTAEGETGSTAPALTMQMHYATLYDIPFSANQAFYIVPEAGLPAGTYHVTFGFNWGTNVKTGTTWQFTTSKALAAGTLLCGFYNAPDVAITSCKVYAYKDQYKSDAQQLSLEELLYNAGLTDNAAEKEDIYKTTTKLFSNDARAFNNLATLAYQRGDYSAAKSYAEKALAIDANSADAKANLGLIALTEGNVAKAENLISQASGASNIQEALGNLHIAQGKYAQAEQDLANINSNTAALAQILNKNYSAAASTLSNIKNADATTDYLKAILNARQGNTTDAANALRNAISKDSS